MLDPKLLSRRPDKTLAGLAIAFCAAAGAFGLSYLNRDRLHFQLGCGEACPASSRTQSRSAPPAPTQQIVLSAGIKAGTGQPEPLYAVQLVRSGVTGGETGRTIRASDPFRDAVNAAMAAANQTQTAQTPAEWVSVAQGWQLAIAHMQAVPPEHPRHALAQQKVEEYGRNFDYAKQNAGSAWESTVTQVSKTADPAVEAIATGMPDGPAGGLAWRLAETSGELRLLLMLLAGGGLAVVLSFEPQRLFQKESAIAAPPKPKPTRQPIPWGLVVANVVHDLWEKQPFFSSERVYKMTAATSAHKLQRKLYRKLVSLTGDQSAALQLIKDNLKRYPGQSANWCCEQAIRDLEKQRQRESRFQKSPEVTEEPQAETSDWL